MRFTISSDDESEIRLLLQVNNMASALEDIAQWLRNQDKYTDNDVTEYREKFYEILKDNEVGLG